MAGMARAAEWGCEVSVREMSKCLGQFGHYRIGVMQVQVKIVDARMSYGVLQYQIQPSAGKGVIWVNAGSVEVLP